MEADILDLQLEVKKGMIKKKYVLLKAKAEAPLLGVLKCLLCKDGNFHLCITNIFGELISSNYYTRNYRFIEIKGSSAQG